MFNVRSVLSGQSLQRRACLLRKPNMLLAGQISYLPELPGRVSIGSAVGLLNPCERSASRPLPDLYPAPEASRYSPRTVGRRQFDPLARGTAPHTPHSARCMHLRHGPAIQQQMMRGPQELPGIRAGPDQASGASAAHRRSMPRARSSFSKLCEPLCCSFSDRSRQSRTPAASPHFHAPPAGLLQPFPVEGGPKHRMALDQILPGTLEGRGVKISVAAYRAADPGILHALRRRGNGTAFPPAWARAMGRRPRCAIRRVRPMPLSKTIQTLLLEPAFGKSEGV